MRLLICLPMVVGLLCFAGTRSATAATYTLRSIVRAGDVVGEPGVEIGTAFSVGALNDRGQVSLTASAAEGGELLLQYSPEGILPLVVPGSDSPVGRWPENNWHFAPVSMNQHGDTVFSGLLVDAGGGTFLWNSEAKKIVPVAVPGMKDSQNHAFAWAGISAAVVNNGHEVAFSASIKDRSGREQAGVFLRREGGELLPVALPDQVLPGGQKIAWAKYPSLSDDGRVAFLVRRQGEEVEYPYLWTNGVVSPLPIAGYKPPPGRLSPGFAAVWLNSTNPEVLLSPHLYSLGAHAYPLYRLKGTSVAPLVIPGQEMPGGGRFKTLQEFGVSAPNARGEFAFLAQLQDGATGAYLLGTDGKLSLILKSGTLTPLGKITSVGPGTGESRGIALNSSGQVALTVATSTDDDLVLLLTPSGS